MYTACIFDLDGTLTDTLESLAYSVNETMRRTVQTVCWERRESAYRESASGGRR